MCDPSPISARGYRRLPCAPYWTPRSMKVRHASQLGWRSDERDLRKSIWSGLLARISSVEVSVEFHVRLLSPLLVQGVHYGYAAEAASVSAASTALTTESRSGLSVTTAIGCQLRVFLAQRLGLAARARV